MKTYGQLTISFWQNQDIQSLSDAAVRLAAFLTAGPYTNVIGAFKLGEGTLADSFEWGTDHTRDAYMELFNIGYCKRCEVTKTVFVCEHLITNKIANPNMAKRACHEIRSLSKKFTYHQELKCRVDVYQHHFGGEYLSLWSRFNANETSGKEVGQTGIVRGLVNP